MARENRAVYGVRKLCKQLQREGQAVARCTVARLMGRLGLAEFEKAYQDRQSQARGLLARRARALEA